MKFKKIRFRRIFHSIIFRVMLIGLLIVVGGSFLRIYVLGNVMQRETDAVVSAQQVALSRHVANDIGQKILLRKELLQRIALTVPAAFIDQPALLNEWLRERQQLLPFFSHGLFIENWQGQILAQYPAQAQPFKATLADTPEQASLGYAGSESVIANTVTLGDAPMQLVLRGLTSLAMPGFLDPISSDKNGKSGGYFLTFPKQHLSIDFLKPGIALKAMPDSGVDTAFDLEEATDHASGLASMANGREEIAARSVVPGTNWTVIAHIPVSEARYVIEHGARAVYRAMPMIVLVYLLLAGAGLYFTLRPFARAARHADRMTRGEIPLAAMPIAYDDEVGDLTASFNRLLGGLADKSKELTVQKEIAESATLAKSRFLAAASHDLRQPMHALNLYLGTLAHLELPEAARSAMTSARHCAQTMDDMFRTLLDISRLDASVTRVEFSVFPIALLLEKIQTEFVQQAQVKGLDLHVAACSAYVMSDIELLENILRNLVSNAIRYTTQGKILLGCRRTSLGLRIGVYDTGPGIADEQQRNIFEEFYQVGNRERDRSQGLGLGLAIVQRQAHLMSAPLSLSSQLGRGSVFAIEVQLASAEDDMPMYAPLEVPKQQRLLSGTLIAIVDDETLILNATRLLLEHWGCSVIAATSGREIIRQLATSPRAPDAIICDHRLRDGETSLDVIAALRNEFNYDIPALLITGDTAPEQMKVLLATGLRIVHKPVQYHVLREVLTKLVNQRPMA